jgi:hypothetical protein
VRLSAELYRAQEIESFDTAVLRFETAEGVRLDFYGTHSSRDIGRPSLRIEAENGTAEWVQDAHARLQGPAGSWQQSAAPESDTRERMLRDVLARRHDASVLVCTPEMAGAHVQYIADLHARTPITPVSGEHQVRHIVHGQSFTYIPGIDELLAAAARTGKSLAETGAPWAVPPTASTIIS